MAYAPRFSEFVEIAVSNAAPTPLDLGGACTVAIVVEGDNVYVSRSRAMTEGERFLILDNVVAGSSHSTPLVMATADEQLWVQGVAGNSVLYAWITREVKS